MASDDRWWQVLDIFTGVDEDVSHTEQLLEAQTRLLAEGLDVDMDKFSQDDGGDIYGDVESVVDGEKEAVDDVPIPVESYNQVSTGENLSLPAGKSGDTIDINLDESGLLYEVGSNDEEYSEYKYIIDGKNLMDEPLVAPIGLYNDTYRFPQPIVAKESISVNIGRQVDAPGPAEYYSKVRYVKVPTSVAEKLLDRWKEL